ncbi:glycosyltransferase family 4 protein [Aromatoleum diolicum]|nr:glycosyltransferase family 4 protein [Aromatoleum diolicum]
MRFEQYLPSLLGLGIDVELAPLLRNEYLERLYAKRPVAWGQVLADYFRRVLCLMSVRKFDLLWIEKELFPDFPAWFERLLHACGIHYVVDYDDAIFHNYDMSGNPLRGLLRRKIDAVMRNASLVICGNEYLAARARLAGANKVAILPTVVDLDRYSLSTKGESGELIVGWVGSASTVKYLDNVLPALRLLSAEFPVRLRVIGATFVAPGIDVECRPWSEGGEVEQIKGFDIGIMPLLDSPWERGKCGYKLIQYMACGVPVIASPVGVNETIVDEGVSGYLASSTEEWVDAFRVLGGNAERRRSMGAQGRAAVEERYCLQVAAPRLAKHFADLGKLGAGR